MSLQPQADLFNEANIHQFCGNVYNQRYEEAVGGLIQVLDAMDKGAHNLRSLEDTDEASRIIAKFAAAVTALICDPNLTLSPQGLSALMSLKTHLRTLFASSVYRDMSHVAAIVGERVDDRTVYQSEDQIAKFLLTCTLDYAEQHVIDFTVSLEGQLKLLFFLSCMDARVYVGSRENEYRHQMLGLRESIMNNSADSIAELQMLTRAWMQCSYWDYADKHLLKSALNHVLRNTLTSLNVNPRELGPRQTGKAKPKLLVVTEHWSADHAMYRCYSKAIDSLSQSFELVGMVIGAASDPKANEIFEQVIHYDVTDSVQEVVNRIQGENPDLLYFPSVGMQQTVIQLVQLRLAPIQLMTAGHPASSFSDEIDYFVIEEDMLGDPDLIAETVLKVSSKAFSYTRPMQDTYPCHHPQDKASVDVVISSMYFKLSPGFIAALAEIQDRAQHDVHFHFLSGLNGLNRIPFERELKKSLGRVTCYEMTPYDEYLMVIARCDLQLAPFPFGNANGFADAMLVGLPVVCLEGEEVHARTDAVWAERIGSPAGCVTTSRDSYISQAVALIDNHLQRAALAKAIQQIDLNSTMFADSSQSAQKEGADDFADLLSWVYLNHEEIRADGRHVWSIADRMLMTSGM